MTTIDVDDAKEIYRTRTTPHRDNKPMHLPLVYAYDQVDNVPYLDFVTYETFDTIQIFVKTHERNMFFFHKNRIFPDIAKYYE